MKAQKIKQFILDFNEIKEEAIGLWGKDEHTGEYNEYLICKNCDNTHHGIGSAEEWEETKDYHKFCTKCGNKFEVETEEVPSWTENKSLISWLDNICK